MEDLDMARMHISLLIALVIGPSFGTNYIRGAGGENG